MSISQVVSTDMDHNPLYTGWGKEEGLNLGGVSGKIISRDLTDEWIEDWLDHCDTDHTVQSRELQRKRKMADHESSHPSEEGSPTSGQKRPRGPSSVWLSPCSSLRPFFLGWN